MAKKITVTLHHVAGKNNVAKFFVDIPLFGSVRGKLLLWNKQWSTDAAFDSDGKTRRYDVVKYCDEAALALAYAGLKLVKSGKNTVDVTIGEELFDTKLGDFRDEDLSEFLPKQREEKTDEKASDKANVLAALGQRKS